MPKLKKILLRSAILLGSLIGFIILTVFLFLSCNPAIGGSVSAEQKQSFERLDNYDNGTFINRQPTSLNMKLSTALSTLVDFIKGDPNREPSRPFDIQMIDSSAIAQFPPHQARLTWFGHSAFLLQLDQKHILLDPMCSLTPFPVPFIGSKRYSRKLPIELQELPEIDAVIFSHDHYDHLDYKSVMLLKDKVKEFYVPLGVGTHLRKWGVDSAKIHELNWWDSITHDSLTLTCTPARHFSGRAIRDRNSTLWASWVIKGLEQNIYFSGDGGYGPHFKEIGDKLGPFDIAMMECGQYNERWEAIHMYPEQTVQAAIDVRGELLIPIHWGAFTLALHAWYDPILRVTAEAARLNQPITTPVIGEPVLFPGTTYPQSKWWEAYLPSDTVTSE